MGGKVIIRDMGEHDARALAQVIDPIDKVEVEAASGLDVQAAVWTAFINSEWSRTAERDGRVLACWGYGPVALDTGCIWLVTSTESHRHPSVFMREGREAVKRGLTTYRALYNQVWLENERAVFWLEALGARFQWEAVMEEKQVRFIPFCFKREDHV